MASRQSSELRALAAKKRVLGNHKRTSSLSEQVCESWRKIVFAARAQYLELQPECGSHPGQVSRLSFGARTVWIDENSNGRRRGYQLMQELQLLGPHLHVQRGHAREVCIWPIKAADEPHLDWIGSCCEDDRYKCGRCLGRQCGRTICKNDGHLTANQIGCHRR